MPWFGQFFYKKNDKMVIAIVRYNLLVLSINFTTLIKSSQINGFIEEQALRQDGARVDTVFSPMDK